MSDELPLEGGEGDGKGPTIIADGKGPTLAPTGTPTNNGTEGADGKGPTIAPQDADAS